MSVIIKKLDNSFIHISNYNRSILLKLQNAFTFYAANYRFNPKYKNGFWDGKISLFDANKNTLPVGLFKDAYQIIKSETNDLICDLCLFEHGVDVSNEEIDKFCETIKLPFKPHEHQYDAIKKCLKHKRLTIVSATSSGKSFILFVVSNMLKLHNPKEKILIVVPTAQLVEQLTKDFDDYSQNWCEFSVNVQKVYSGVKNKPGEKFITISTWQSINSTKDKSFLENYTTVLCDECHQANAKSLTKITNLCVNAEYKIGFTGSLGPQYVSERQLNGLFGPIENIISARELIDKGMAAEFDISCLILEHTLENRFRLQKKFADLDSKEYHETDRYNLEMDFIRSIPERLQFFVDFCNRIDKNTILMFKNIEYGKKLFYELRTKTKKRVYYIDGNVKIADRELIRNNMEKYNNCILVGSYKTISTGLNIKNIWNIGLIESSKSDISIIQIIGRSLRKLGDKRAKLIDFVDDLSNPRFTNYSLRHFRERYRVYKKEKHDVKLLKMKL